MIFEYMAYGDLTEVLRNSNEQFTSRSLDLPIVDKVSDGDGPRIHTICIDICSVCFLCDFLIQPIYYVLYKMTLRGFV